MKSKTLLSLVQFALVMAIGTAQLQRALPIMAKLAHRTAAPLEQMVRLGVNPSYPGSPVPGVQPYDAPVVTRGCNHMPMMAQPPVHVRDTVLRVQAERPTVETIADPVQVKFVAPRRIMLAGVADRHAIAELVRLADNRAQFNREMARAQREIARALREARRQQAFRARRNPYLGG